MALGDGSGTAALPEGLLADHREAFVARFGGGAPPRLFLAPGRVNLMGAHLDYNGGPVMPMAIDRCTFLALRLRADARVRLASTHTQDAFELDLASLPAGRTGTWADYPLGVLRSLADRVSGRPGAPGVEILFGGNLPVAAGLSSSASICVGTAFALDRAWGLELTATETVAVALAAEREFVGVQCGIMDPYAVGLARAGHILVLDCKDESFEHVPLDTAGLRVGVVDSGVRRELAQSEFNSRVSECRMAFDALRGHAPDAACLRDVPLAVLDAHAAELDPTVARRARHVLTEVERTFAARRALLAGDAATFGGMMLAAHRSLCTDYEVSVPELDCLVEAAERTEGCLGARLTGAGFGGCAVYLLRTGAEEELAGRVAELFGARFGRRPEPLFFQGSGGPREVE